MEDDIDIYEDLDSISKKYDEQNAKVDEKILEYQRTCSSLEERAKNIGTENVNLKKEIQSLKINLSSLLKTAKNEIARKDRNIAELRKQLDDMHFRRNNYKIPKINKPDNSKNISNINAIKKDIEVERTPELTATVTKCGSEYINPHNVMDDDRNNEEIHQSSKLTATVFGERLKKRLKDEEEKERLHAEESKLLNSVTDTNGITDKKSEIKDTNVNTVDNKENQYRLIPLDSNSPKTASKRPNEDRINEYPDKRRKFNDVGDGAQSYKKKKMEYNDKSTINENNNERLAESYVNTSEYFCSTQTDCGNYDYLYKRTKRKDINDYNNLKVHPSWIDDRRDDRNNKTYSKNYNDRSRKFEVNKTYLNKNRRYDNQNLCYDSYDNFKRRNRPNDQNDLRNHLNKRSTPDHNYNGDSTRTYADESPHCEVRRSRRIEERSHSKYSKFQDDDRDSCRRKSKSEDKTPTKKKSRSLHKSPMIKSPKSVAAHKNELRQTKECQQEKMKTVDNDFSDISLEEGEIAENMPNTSVQIIEQILTSDDAEKNDVFECSLSNVPFTSSNEERIECIQEFIENYRVDEVLEKNDKHNENLVKNLDKNEEKLVQNDRPTCKKDDKTENDKVKDVTEKCVSVQLDNLVNLENPNKKIDSSEKCVNKEILMNKKISEATNSTSIVKISSDDSATKETTVEKKNEIVVDSCNEEKQEVTDVCPIDSSVINLPASKPKPRIVKIDDVTGSTNNAYNSVLSMYLKRKSVSSKTSVRVNALVDKSDANIVDNKINGVKIDNKIESKPIETTEIESEKLTNSLTSNVDHDHAYLNSNKTDYSVKLNSSMEKSSDTSAPSCNSSDLKSDNTSEVSSESKTNDLECVVPSQYSKKYAKRYVKKNTVNICKKSNKSDEIGPTKTTVSRKKKEQIDENQNLQVNKPIMLISRRRRAVQLSDFSTPVTVILSVENTN